MLKVIRYSRGYEEDWNRFVSHSKNGTFLFDRKFMEYHGDRYDDHSLIVFYKTKIVALLPANQGVNIIYSHAGLSYGGFIVCNDMRASLMLDVFDAVKQYYSEQCISELYYKSVPYIYHKQPADEELYALFRSNAELYRRDISTVIKLQGKLNKSNNSVRNIKRAVRSGVEFKEANELSEFYNILEQALSRHDVAPVHSLVELIRLKDQFPQCIKLYVSLLNDEVVAGVLVFISDQVVHTQYLASSEKGRKVGGLDYVVSNMIALFSEEKRYLSFGHSTLENGRVLNEGLIRQKEGFGGRSIVHDFYKINIL